MKRRRNYAPKAAASIVRSRVTLPSIALKNEMLQALVHPCKAMVLATKGWPHVPPILKGRTLPMK
jgi:hypothetical protein